MLEYCENHDIELPWDDVTGMLSPTLSKTAVVEHIRRLERGRIQHGILGLLIGTLDDYDRDHDLQLSLIIRQVCNAHCISLDWDEIAKSMSERLTTDPLKPKVVSGEALKRHIKSHRDSRIAKGLPVPPALFRGDYPVSSDARDKSAILKQAPYHVGKKERRPVDRYEEQWRGRILPLMVRYV